MSALSLALLLAAATATAAGAAALHSTRGLRKQIAALRADLAAAGAERRERAQVPHARPAPGAEIAEIRAAVADALAEERERELAEARAFWAAQEARDPSGADAPSLLGGLPGLGDDLLGPEGPYGSLYLPRQADLVGLEPLSEAASAAEAEAEESPELAAARRRHPSHPDFTPAGLAGDHESTVERLAELSDARIPLTDVRPGPLGTLDVYVFADGTTLCMTPGHRETAERLGAALDAGDAPVLLGGSGVSGAYALTFSCAAERIYVLADRVIASP
ncbi:hypothetical protein AF335_21600 [Streptomyces eurocidicus]|uniref:Secreted protein n=1 Tax=Streptomyces eurocidicus TaxID=66423 RepID=A0A2N8NT24_STREU|nr:hypothetical protein [Streptomyces eurocidicus]MBB5120144.1 hypothetical protein [Streptomyces eurocidicus]MBF6051125.1 hypothetical protein [Streptomyces eurocidicus]PNE31902.1 hypothetical protein AF335_21600 [Streptomyces eurocidicus]